MGFVAQWSTFHSRWTTSQDQASDEKPRIRRESRQSICSRIILQVGSSRFGRMVIYLHFDIFRMEKLGKRLDFAHLLLKGAHSNLVPVPCHGLKCLNSATVANVDYSQCPIRLGHSIYDESYTILSYQTKISSLDWPLHPRHGACSQPNSRKESIDIKPVPDHWSMKEIRLQHIASVLWQCHKQRTEHATGNIQTPRKLKGVSKINIIYTLPSSWYLLSKTTWNLFG